VDIVDIQIRNRRLFEMSEISQCDKTAQKKYSIKYQKSFSIDNPANFFNELSKIRPKTLKNLILLKMAYAEQIKNNFSSFESNIHSIDFVQEVLGCNKATAYDYLRSITAISVISDMELDAIRSCLKQRSF